MMASTTNTTPNILDDQPTSSDLPRKLRRLILNYNLIDFEEETIALEIPKGYPPAIMQMYWQVRMSFTRSYSQHFYMKARRARMDGSMVNDRIEEAQESHNNGQQSQNALDGHIQLLQGERVDHEAEAKRLDDMETRAERMLEMESEQLERERQKEAEGSSNKSAFPDEETTSDEDDSSDDDPSSDEETSPEPRKLRLKNITRE